MLTEGSNSCPNRHHRHHRHHHKHHRRHGRHKNSMEKSVSKKLRKSVNNELTGDKTEDSRTKNTSEENSNSRTENSGKQERKHHHAGRVLRNRRYRRPFEDHRHTKRLFTPEIKRFLKSWLVRRRDNPYPSREEKKGLAVQTGLTYIQICNWFANWRRKLKNAGSEAQHRTWGNLIKSYNTKAQGNVEQFSLCSDDSIWEEPELSDTGQDETDGVASTAAPLSHLINATAMDHSYSVLFNHPNIQNSNSAAPVKDISSENTSQNHQIEPCLNIKIASEPQAADEPNESNQDSSDNTSGSNNNKYKNVIMEKYLTNLKGCQDLKEEKKLEKSSHLAKKRHSEDNEEEDDGSEQDNVNLHVNNSNISQNEVIKNGCANLARKSKRHKKEESHPFELSKWLESAAKFKPGQNYITWAAKNVTWQSNVCEAKNLHQWNSATTEEENFWPTGQHHREELDAAEALTCLSTYHN